MTKPNHSAAAAIAMLSRIPIGSVVRVAQGEVAHTRSCAKFSGRTDLLITSFADFDKAFLLIPPEDEHYWQVAYPLGCSSNDLYVPWLEYREPSFDVVSREALKDLPNLVLVWRFSESPEHIKCSVGGDEDWLAVLPLPISKVGSEEALGREEFFWLDQWFGCCDVDFLPLSENRCLAIGCH